MFETVNKGEVLSIAAELINASVKYKNFNNSYGTSKAEVCKSIALKVTKYKSFASEAQRSFALSLIKEASTERPEYKPQTYDYPNIARIIKGFAKLYYRNMVISKKNGVDLWFIMINNVCAGKMEGSTVVLWDGRLRNAGTNRDEVTKFLADFNADPMEAMKADGRRTGRCCCCGRELTDPDSIAAGIGPICEAKASGF